MGIDSYKLKSIGTIKGNIANPITSTLFTFSDIVKKTFITPWIAWEIPLTSEYANIKNYWWKIYWSCEK